MEESTAGLVLRTWHPNAVPDVVKYPSRCCQARVVISPPNPFWAQLASDYSLPGHGFEAQYNSHVADNLEGIGELLLRIAKATDPWAMGVYTDTGWPVPHNSHCSYYSCNDAVLDELEIERSLWTAGLPAVQVPPLRDYDERKHEFLLSTLRNKEQRLELWGAFKASLDERPKPTIEAVELAKNLTSMDIKVVGDGFFVWDHPYFLNAFIVNFILDAMA